MFSWKRHGNNTHHGNHSLPNSTTGNPSSQNLASTLGIHLKHGSASMAWRRIAIISVISVVLCLTLVFCLLATFCWMRKSRKKRPPSVSVLKDKHLNLSYAELFKATHGFSPQMLIGAGRYGYVYKGILEKDETVVAVKLLNLRRRGASKSFMAECEALRNIRHRNLVKILTACSSLDHHGDDFKALIFEFMPNESLDEWLHPQVCVKHPTRNLSFIQRLNIAIDVAYALDYLHHHCHTPIVHCNIKPSNILLDYNMTAHVSDFGLSKILCETYSQPFSSHAVSAVIKGSKGYVAPEYEEGCQVSTYGDVYSYGILLLELFTGRRPTGHMFLDGLNLHKFVKMAMPNRVKEIVDPSLLFEVEERATDSEKCWKARSAMEECLASILGIGLSCSRESARERMMMKDVVVGIQEIRELFVARCHKENLQFLLDIAPNRG